MNRRDFLKKLGLVIPAVLVAKKLEVIEPDEVILEAETKPVIYQKAATSKYGIIDSGPHRGTVVSMNSHGYYIPYHSSATYGYTPSDVGHDWVTLRMNRSDDKTYYGFGALQGQIKWPGIDDPEEDEAWKDL